MPAASIAIRVNRSNPNHHLWDNNGTWWVHYTLHLSDYTLKRVRRSLRTNDQNKARSRRDNLFAQLAA